MDCTCHEIMAGDSSRHFVGCPKREASEWSWAHVEINGHREHHGQARSVPFLGTTFLEVLELDRDGRFDAPRRYGAGAVFSVSEWTEEAIRVYVLPTGGIACGAWAQPSARPGLCANCGATEQAHKEAAEARAKSPASDDDIAF